MRRRARRALVAHDGTAGPRYKVIGPCSFQPGGNCVQRKAESASRRWQFQFYATASRKGKVPWPGGKAFIGSGPRLVLDHTK